MAEKLTGIFTPTLVPVDARGEINEAEMRRFISWLIDSGVHGLYPNADRRSLFDRISGRSAATAY